MDCFQKSRTYSQRFVLDPNLTDVGFDFNKVFQCVIVQKPTDIYMPHKRDLLTYLSTLATHLENPAGIICLGLEVYEVLPG